MMMARAARPPTSGPRFVSCIQLIDRAATLLAAISRTPKAVRQPWRYPAGHEAGRSDVRSSQRPYERHVFARCQFSASFLFLQLIPLQARRGVRATRELALHDSSLLGRARQRQERVLRRPTDLTRVAAFPSYCATRRLGASKRHASSSRVRRSVTCTFERRTRTVG
jgi:hypothetical protein